MSLVSCSLQFENSTQYYRPGEVIKGLVIFTVNSNSAILIKGLSIQFAGYAACKWEKPQATQKSAKPQPKEFYVNREDYVSSKNYLIGSDDANPSSLQPGVYNYSFMVHVPTNAPSSFEGSLGSIRYDLQIHAHYSEHSDCLHSSILNVEQLKDLRRLDAVEQTLTEKDIVEYKSCLNFWQHPLQLYVSIPQVAYTVGECISVHIKISNHGKIKLKDITSKMNRIVSYQGFIKEKKHKITTDITTVACNIHSLFGQNCCVIQYLQQIYVPMTPTSLDFSECRCISISYELEVTISAQKHERSIKAVIPIVVGSISLTSDIKILQGNSSSSSCHAPTISVARSMDELNLPSRLDMEDQNQLEMHQMNQINVSMMSLASSFKEADFMTPVKLNKKSKFQLAGDPIDFKPKYLYYDLPAELQTNLQEDSPSSGNIIQLSTTSTMEQF